MRTACARFLEPGPLLRELQILALIGRNPRASQRAIAQEVGLCPSMVHNYLRGLERHGLVKFRGASRSKLQYVLTEEGSARAELLAGRLLAETGDLIAMVAGRIRHAAALAAEEGVRVLGILANPLIADTLAKIAKEAGVLTLLLTPREGEAGVTIEALPSRPDAVLVADDPTRKENFDFLEACRKEGVPVRTLV